MLKLVGILTFLLCTTVFGFDVSTYIENEINSVHKEHILYKTSSPELWEMTLQHLPVSMDNRGLFFTAADIERFKYLDPKSSADRIKNNDDLSYIEELWKVRSLRAFQLSRVLEENKDSLARYTVGFLKSYQNNPSILYQSCKRDSLPFVSTREELIKNLQCFFVVKIIWDDLQFTEASFNFVFEVIKKHIEFYNLPSTEIRLAEAFLKSYLEQLDPHTVFIPTELPKTTPNAPYEFGVILKNYDSHIVEHGGKRFAYLRVGTFEENAATITYNNLKRLMKENVTLPGIILDLRGNSGGYVDEAANIIRFFVEDDQLFHMEYSDGRIISAGDKFSKMFLDFNLSWSMGLSSVFELLGEYGVKKIYRGKLIVLVDEDSASASELVAGSLQALGRAVVVGSKRTFGKGTGFQTIAPTEEQMASGELLNAKTVTSLYYYFVNGDSPQGLGVSSDIVISQVPKLTFESTLYRPLPRRAPTQTIIQKIKTMPVISELDTLRAKSYERRQNKWLNPEEATQEAHQIMVDWLEIQNP